MKKVTEDEFNQFVRNYPKALERDISSAFEPPLVTYNDFSDGRMWPDSVVASRIIDKDNSCYMIMEDKP
jgi:hypothetical protein